MKKIIPLSRPFIGSAERKAVIQILQSGKLAQGEKVAELENKFKHLCDTSYAIATNNGTSALHTALHAVGIKPGDEVITTPFTFIATVNSILMMGARPVFVDIDENTYAIDPHKIEAAITHKTKAILAVDLYGQPADYDAINTIAKKYHLPVIEDAAQSIGATYKKKQAGNLADISCFSLYATKNIMCGEGGMITTNNKKYYKNAHLFRQHGEVEDTRFVYDGLGYNYRMMDLQAGIALAQFERLDRITNKRLKIAKKYHQELAGISGLVLPYVQKNATHVYHQFTIRITSEFKTTREQFIAYLGKKGIGVGVYYPAPLHLVPHIARYGYKKDDFPISELASLQVLSIPVHPLVSEEEIDYIIDCIKSY